MRDRPVIAVTCFVLNSSIVALWCRAQLIWREDYAQPATRPHYNTSCISGAFINIWIRALSMLGTGGKSEKYRLFSASHSSGMMNIFSTWLRALAFFCGMVTWSGAAIAEDPAILSLSMEHLRDTATLQDVALDTTATILLSMHSQFGANTRPDQRVRPRTIYLSLPNGRFVQARPPVITGR
jgi:hypothetical protein